MPKHDASKRESIEAVARKHGDANARPRAAFRRTSAFIRVTEPWREPACMAQMPANTEPTTASREGREGGTGRESALKQGRRSARARRRAWLMPLQHRARATRTSRHANLAHKKRHNLRNHCICAMAAHSRRDPMRLQREGRGFWRRGDIRGALLQLLQQRARSAHGSKLVKLHAGIQNTVRGR